MIQFIRIPHGPGRYSAVSARCGPAARATVEAIAAAYGLTWGDILGPCRTRYVSQARQEIMAALYATGQYSYPEIARFLNRKDHTTVIHGVRAHRAREQGRAAA